MIQPQLYYIMASSEYMDEPFGTHAIGVDMDLATAKLIIRKEFEFEDNEDFTILEMSTVVVDGWDITLTEKEGK